MCDRKLLLYFAWSRPGETEAPLADIDDRFPAVFELRRLFYPKFEDLSDASVIDQGIAGFLDHVQKPNFQAFAALAQRLTGHAPIEVERVGNNGTERRLGSAVIDDADTIVIISFDSFRTAQSASDEEIAAVRHFLDDPDHLLVVCPHHDIGEVTDTSHDDGRDRQIAEHLHHGDRAIPQGKASAAMPGVCWPGWACRSRTISACAPPRRRTAPRPRSTSMSSATSSA